MNFTAKNEYRSSYKFLDNIFLSAIVSKSSGKQTLLIEKIDSKTGNVEFSEKIECIHTAVIDLSPNQVVNLSNEKILNKKSIHIRSSENLMEIDLEPQEKFKAFNSWVAGIAESGFDALRIQSQIENEGKLIFPLTHLLMKFFSRVNLELMLSYIQYLKRVCVYEGVQHKSSLISNLSPIFSLLRNEEFPEKNKITIIKSIFEINPPLEIFTEEPANMIFLELPDAISMNKFTDLFSQNRDIRYHLINNPMITEFKEFSQFLSYESEPDGNIRKIAGYLEKACKFKEFSNFLSYQTEPNHRVRKIAAKNPSVIKFDEFRNFLDYQTEPNDNVRKMAARNINSVKFDEFRNFLSYKTEPSSDVRSIAFANPNSTKFEEYKEFLDNEIESMKELRSSELQKSGKIITGKDFKNYFKLKNKLESLNQEFTEDYQELINEIKEMEEYLLPPDIELEEDILRELQRLKKINLRRKNKS